METLNNYNNIYVLVTGNTGVGKSTVAEYISAKYKIELISDPFVENPFISDSLSEQNNKSFQSQLFFFKEFIKIHKYIGQSKSSIIQERSLFESVNVFCKLFYQNGFFSKDELNVFEDLLLELKSQIKLPDLIIYIESDLNVNALRVIERNRDFESKFDIQLLSKQKEIYKEWISGMESQKIEIIKVNNTNLSLAEFKSKCLIKFENWLHSHSLRLEERI